MIAQHFEQKGLPQAMEAIAKIDAKNRPTLIVVGKDDSTGSMKQAQQLGLARRVIFAGMTDSPADFYAAADFFILPTSHDSCSLVVLEALAMGLPVISTIFNGACEIMTDGREGFVLKDPKNVPQLTDAIEQMLMPIPRESMRQAALALRPRLSFDAHLDRLEEIYQSVRNQSAH
jgi:UDP-glucose:(heptosyl)LPS alpha-1,3-glucosyltransferase